MEIKDTNGKYSTSTTSLAAYLYMQGFTLLDVINERFPTLFVFESNGLLPDCVRKFQTAQAEGNLVLYFEAYQKCLKMIKVGKL